MAGGASVVLGFIGMNKAEQASERAEALSAAELDFAMERYDDWKAIFGPLEENMADFYNNLTPEVLETAGLELQSEEFSKAREQAMTTLEQRGLTGSGLEADFTAKSNLTSAESRAKIRRDAPFKVAEMQQGFLNSNITEKSASMAGVSQTMSRNTNRAEQDAISMWDSSGRLLSTGLESYGRRSPTADEGTTESYSDNDYNEFDDF